MYFTDVESGEVEGITSESRFCGVEGIEGDGISETRASVAAISFVVIYAGLAPIVDGPNSSKSPELFTRMRRRFVHVKVDASGHCSSHSGEPKHQRKSESESKKVNKRENANKEGTI